MFDPDEKLSDLQGTSVRAFTRRHAILVSVLFHILLLVALLCWYVPNHSNSVLLTGDETATGPKPRDANVQEEPSFPPTSGENVPANEIEASLRSAMKDAEALTDELQLSELEKNLNRLNDISSDVSVQDATQKIANTLGLAPGPLPAVGPVAGTFDTDTAQIYDVTRSRNKDGDWVYQSILVDAAGRTQKIDLPRAEGESSYSTFQQLKQFPIADSIYRQVVMPMLQNMLNAADVAEAQALELRKQKADEQSALQGPVTPEQRVPAEMNTPFLERKKVR